MRSVIRTGLVAFCGLVATPIVTFAQDNPWVKVGNTAGTETLPATPLLYGAYAFVWAAVALYVVWMWRRLGRIETELQQVNAKLAARRK